MMIMITIFRVCASIYHPRHGLGKVRARHGSVEDLCEDLGHGNDPAASGFVVVILDTGCWPHNTERTVESVLRSRAVKAGTTLFLQPTVNHMPEDQWDRAVMRFVRNTVESARRAGYRVKDVVHHAEAHRMLYSVRLGDWSGDRVRESLSVSYVLEFLMFEDF